MPNLHPIFVHFPVAFFSIYAVLEFIRFKKITSQPYWFYVKGALVIIGSAVSYITLVTGVMAKELVKHDPYIRPIVQKHELFAVITVAIFSFIAAGYLVAWINRQMAGAEPSVVFNNRLWQLLSAISNFILSGWPVVILAVLGLMAVTITGGLGGAMVYGPKADPFFKPVFEFLIKK